MSADDRRQLDPDIREAFIRTTVEAILADLREHPVLPPSQWMNVDEAGAYARVGRRMIYKAIAAKKLRAAHVDGRRKIAIHRDWIDAWLRASAPESAPHPK